MTCSAPESASMKSSIRTVRAFTLIELLVVIAVILVLAGITVPVTSRIVQNARAASCTSNLRQLGAALNLYLGDHNQVMPTLQEGRSSTTQNVPVIDNTLNTYVSDPRVFACPADNKGLDAATGTSYAWNNGLNGQSATNLTFFLSNGHNSQIPLMGDKEGFHPYALNKVNLLYADGHISQELTFGIAH